MNRNIKKIMIILVLSLVLPWIAFANGGGEDKQEDVSLNFVLYGSSAQDFYDDLYGAYSEENPDVTINWEMPNDSSVLIARINAGDIPDAFMLENYAQIFSYEDFLYDFSNEDFVKDLIPFTLEGVKKDGKILAIPNSIQGYGLIYNKSLFAQAGITDLPETLDELEEVAEKLQKAGITPFTPGFGDGWPIFQMYSTFLGQELPGETVSKLSTGEISFPDLSINDNFFRFIDLQVKYSEGNSLDSTYTDQLNDMATGKVAMIHQGEWAEFSILEITKEIDLGFIPVPVNNNPADSKLSINPANFWVVNKNGIAPEKAVDVIGWKVTDPKGMNKTIELFIPPSVNAPKPDSLLKQEVLRLANEGKGRAWSFTYWPQGWNEQLWTLIQEYLLGDKTQDEIEVEMQKYWDKLK